MSSKVSPAFVIRANWRSYVDVRTGKPMWSDRLTFTVPPAALAVAWAAAGWQIPGSTRLALACVLAFVGAAMIGVAAMMSAEANRFAISRPEKCHTTTTHAKLLSEVTANSAYAGLVGGCSAVGFGVAAALTGEPASLISAAGAGFALHWVLAMLMTIKRIAASAEKASIEAQVGTYFTNQWVP